jgi:ectoine hydroxylase-related dioxygenase (phytanoyl-CoA dioxygenase family)
VLEHSVLERPKGYVPGFLRFNQSLAPYLVHPRVLRLMESVFGPHVRVSMFTGSVNAPGLPRGPLHADWPFNQNSRAHIPAPYPDVLLHLVTFWMLTDFTLQNGATIIVPGSHKRSTNPTASGEADADKPQPGEARLVGERGTVAVVDARMWHAEAANESGEERVAVIARYAPWWLNLDTLRPGTVDHHDIVEAHEGADSRVPALSEDVYQRLPDAVKPLLRYSVDR